MTTKWQMGKFNTNKAQCFQIYVRNLQTTGKILCEKQLTEKKLFVNPHNYKYSI